MAFRLCLLLLLLMATVPVCHVAAQKAGSFISLRDATPGVLADVSSYSQSRPSNCLIEPSRLAQYAAAAQTGSSTQFSNQNTGTHSSSNSIINARNSWGINSQGDLGSLQRNLPTTGSWVGYGSDSSQSSSGSRLSAGSLTAGTWPVYGLPSNIHVTKADSTNVGSPHAQSSPTSHSGQIVVPQAGFGSAQCDVSSAHSGFGTAQTNFIPAQSGLGCQGGFGSHTVGPHGFPSGHSSVGSTQGGYGSSQAIDLCSGLSLVQSNLGSMHGGPSLGQRVVNGGCTPAQSAYGSSQGAGLQGGLGSVTTYGIVYPAQIPSGIMPASKQPSTNLFPGYVLGSSSSVPSSSFGLTCEQSGVAAHSVGCQTGHGPGRTTVPHISSGPIHFSSAPAPGTGSWAGFKSSQGNYGSVQTVQSQGKFLLGGLQGGMASAAHTGQQDGFGLSQDSYGSTQALAGLPTDQLGCSSKPAVGLSYATLTPTFDRHPLGSTSTGIWPVSSSSISDQTVGDLGSTYNYQGSLGTTQTSSPYQGGYIAGQTPGLLGSTQRTSEKAFGKPTSSYLWPTHVLSSSSSNPLPVASGAELVWSSSQTGTGLPHSRSNLGTSGLFQSGGSHVSSGCVQGTSGPSPDAGSSGNTGISQTVSLQDGLTSQGGSLAQSSGFHSGSAEQGAYGQSATASYSRLASVLGLPAPQGGFGSTHTVNTVKTAPSTSLVHPTGLHTINGPMTAVHSSMPGKVPI